MVRFAIAMKVNKPNFFIVGAGKCGTTALYTYLREHPQIFMSPIKEPQFFATDLLGDRRTIRTMQDYLGLFAAVKDEQKVGEASTAYFNSESAPREIKAFAPEAQIIIMLRNPVDKMYARYTEARLNNREHHRSFELALLNEQKYGPSSGIGYWESARYVDKVKRYFTTFGRESVHVIIYDDFASNTLAVYKDVLRFLGVDFDGRSEFPVVNPHSRVRGSMVVQEFFRHPPERLREVVRTVVPRAVRRLSWNFVLRVNLAHEPRPALQPELRKRLQQGFKEEVGELGRLIGRDLSHWCE